MKISFYLPLLFLALSSCTATNNEIALNDVYAVNKTIKNTWKTAYIELNGSRNEIPKEQEQNITFYGDGSYTSKLSNGIVEKKGKWKYESNKQMLYMHEVSNTSGQRVLKLTNNELVIAGYTYLNDEIIDSNIVTLKRI